MELVKNQNNPIEQTAESSFHTEDEFSIINRPAPDLSEESILQDASLPENNSAFYRNGTENLYTSHSALTNACEHMKRKIRELDLQNRSLRKRISSQGSNSMASGNNENMMNSHENDVTKAWEAYSIKLKECERLRDELREAENKVNKLKNTAKPQSIREDAIRAQTFQEEMKKSLQQSELEKRDLRNKENLAREELVKEKEYHERVLRATEQKHHAMESDILELKRQLKNKDSQISEIKKEHELKLMRNKEILQEREVTLKEKIMRLEGRVIQEQEERGRLEQEKGVLEEKLARLSSWKQEVEHKHQTSGLPLVNSLPQNFDIGDNFNSLDDEINPLELINELQSLTEEIITLKKHTSQQSLIISRICEDPRIYESLMEMSKQNQAADLTMPVQCTENDRLKIVRKNSSTLSSMDTRSVIDEAPSASTFGSLTTNNVNGIVLNRKIHMMEPGTSSLPNSPHRIEVPPDDENLSTAFNNLRINENGNIIPHIRPTRRKSRDENLNVLLPPEQSEHPTAYYSAGETIPSLAANRIQVPPCINGSLNSDPGTGSSSGSSNTNTIELINQPPQESTSIRYPPNSNHPMKAIWPSAGAAIHTHNPIWPPDSNAEPSFDLIAGVPGNSAQLNPGIVPADDQPPNRAKFQNKPQKEVDAARVAAQRELLQRHLQDSHIPITRPRNRATRGAPSQNPAPHHSHDTTPIDNRLRENDDMESIDVITDDVEERATRYCPMCRNLFDNVTVRFLERHVNDHFNDNAASETNTHINADLNA